MIEIIQAYDNQMPSIVKTLTCTWVYDLHKKLLVNFFYRYIISLFCRIT